MAKRPLAIFLIVLPVVFSSVVPDVWGALFMERFDWLPSESAHRQYPMTLLKGDLILKDGSYLYVPARAVMRNGWGEIGSTHVVGKKMKALPVRLTATWFSFAEDRFFSGDFTLPYDKIINLFRKGTISPSFEKRVPYDRLIVGIGPEGAISLWASADGEVIEVARYRGKEITVDWKEVLDNDRVTRREYIDGVLKDSLTQDQYRTLKQRGIPKGASEYYNRTYRWNLLVSGGSRHKILVKCLNGEAEYFDFVQTDNTRTQRALPKELEVRWSDKLGTLHMAYVLLDEAEIDAAFKKLSDGNREHPIQLQLEIGAGRGLLQTSVKDARYIIRLNKTAIKR